MLENEQNIIGAILLDNEALDKVCEKIKPEMFQSSLYREIYREMLDMYDSGQDIDFTLVAQRLEDRERSREFLMKELLECMEVTPTSAFIKNYADVLVNDWRSRAVSERLRVVDTTPNNINDTIGDLITFFEGLVENKVIKDKTFEEIVKENRDNYFKDTVGQSNIKTGFYNVDELIGGLEGGDVTIIAARPGCGKSAFATQIVENIAKKGFNVGYFNLEMRESQVYERLVSHGISHKDGLTRLRRAKAFQNDSEKEEFERINDRLSQYKGRVISDCFSVRAIRSKCRHRNFDVVVIDYMQLIESDKRHNSRNEEVGAISRAIKKLAMELNIHIIVLSQLNRASEGRRDKEPTPAELRESGAIEQDASNIIMIWNLNNDEPCIYKGVAIKKSRQSKTGKIGMTFDGAHMVFNERIGEDFYQLQKRAKGNEKDTVDDEDDYAKFIGKGD